MVLFKRSYNQRLRVPGHVALLAFNVSADYQTAVQKSEEVTNTLSSCFQDATITNCGVKDDRDNNCYGYRLNFFPVHNIQNEDEREAFLKNLAERIGDEVYQLGDGRLNVNGTMVFYNFYEQCHSTCPNGFDKE